MGTLKAAGSEIEKQTNEIGMAIPLLEGCDIADRDITADALLTQRFLAQYIVERGAHYHFTVKGNQPSLEKDIALLFVSRGAPDFAEPPQLAHGRIETRRIWCSTALNDYLDFPYVGQCWLIERETFYKKTGKRTIETALGITSRTPEQMPPKRVLKTNREHWTIEAVHNIIDWNYDEDRCRIRKGHGPANISRLRFFAVSVLTAFRKPGQSIAEMMRKLCFRSRTVLDYLRLTKNSSGATRAEAMRTN